MTRPRALTWMAVPGLMAAAWHQHRRAARELEMTRVQPPLLGGAVHSLAMPWGRLSYRLKPGAAHLPPLVLVHGWGRTSDSAWWPLIQRSEQTVLALDLPGHGRSLLETRFSFRLAAQAVVAATEHAGIEGATLVGHSMGGPVSMSALRRAPAGMFTGFVAVATSAYWVTPRQRVKVAAAPWVLASRSPILVRAQHRESLRSPEDAHRIAWEYAVRPSRQVLLDAAVELRRFDATRWGNYEPPPTTWVVAERDGVIDPRHQRRSAELMGARAVHLPTDHSVVVEAPDLLYEIVRRSHRRTERPLLIAL